MPSYNKRVELPGRTALELYSTISPEIERFLATASLGNFDVTYAAEIKQIQLKSSMFTATLLCKDDCITLNGQLSLLASPFKSKIDEGIDRWLTKTFGTQT